MQPKVADLKIGEGGVVIVSETFYITSNGLSYVKVRGSAKLYSGDGFSEDYYEKNVVAYIERNHSDCIYCYASGTWDDFYQLLPISIPSPDDFNVVYFS